MNCSYRDIAKLLARGMPVDGQEYSDIIEDYIKSLEAMPAEQQATLKAAYIFSGLGRREERQDLFQELVSHTLEVLSRHSSAISDLEGFCYTVASHRWSDLWKTKKRRKRILNGGFISLNEPVRDSLDGDIELQETITGEIEFESKLNSELDSQAILNALPDKVKTAVIKRLAGREQLSSTEQNIIWRYAKQNGGAIREAISA